MTHELETLPAGTRIDAFEIISLIGRGGMGAVYKAIDRTLDRHVAIKTVDRGMTEDPVSLERFRREAKAASAINHPNVVSIFAFGVRGNLPYMVMELLRGQSLADVLAQQKLTVERTADIFLGVCAGLYAAHRHGIVHRDLKPQNVFLTKTWLGETPKILDFGIAKALGGAELTDEGHIIGSPYYLSPEQVIRGRVVDARADQFSLGVMLFQCVTGQLPYRSHVLAEQFDEVRRGQFIRPSAFDPDLSPAFESVVVQAMMKDPAKRFESARALGKALLPFASVHSQRKWSEHYVSYNAAMIEFEPSGPGAVDPKAPTKVPSGPVMVPPLDQTIIDPETDWGEGPETEFLTFAASSPVPAYRPEFDRDAHRRASDGMRASTAGEPIAALALSPQSPQPTPTLRWRSVGIALALVAAAALLFFWAR